MDLASATREYEAATREFLLEARQVSEGSLDHHVPGGWSARQIIHHVADSETQSHVRLRRLLAEPAGSLVQGYDEAAWAQCDVLGYQELPVEHSLEVFAAVRRATAHVLARLVPADLERYGTHSETGRYSVTDWLEIYTRHPREHAAQLVEAKDAV
jgi:hypothetical protein